MKVFSIYKNKELIGLSDDKENVMFFLYSRDLRNEKEIHIIEDNMKKKDYLTSDIRLIDWYGVIVTTSEKDYILEDFINTFQLKIRKKSKYNDNILMNYEKDLIKYIRFCIFCNKVNEIKDIYDHMKSIRGEFNVTGY